METKKCNKCNFSFNKDINNFHKRKTSPDGFNTICKNCVKIAKPREVKHIKNNQLLCLCCKVYKDFGEFANNKNKIHRNCKNGKCRQCVKEYSEKRRVQNRGDQGLERILTERFCAVRDRSKINGLGLDFNRGYLKELWEQQNGLCAISKIPMTALVFCGRVPTNVSVDRIDSKRGYIKGNVQLVCMAVNQMKSDLTTEELLYFCKQIINNYQK